MKNYLFKFFTNEQYIETFRMGHIRLMSTYYYATLNEEGELKDLYNNRYDLTEGRSLLINKDYQGTLSVKFGNEMKIYAGPGVERMAINSEEESGKYKISCFYTIENKDIPSGNFGEVIKTMQHSLGNYYIAFLNPAVFTHKVQDKVNELIAQGIVENFKMDYVKYYDAEKYVGITNPFQKPDKLKWQREYRLLLKTKNVQDPFILNIGDIHGITGWGKVEDLCQGYIVNDATIYIPNIQT